MSRKNHGKHCDCPVCAARNAAAYLKRIDDTSRMIPETIHQTVAVRAHWRRHPGHLRKMPNTRSALRDAILNLMKGTK